MWGLLHPTLPQLCPEPERAACRRCYDLKNCFAKPPMPTLFLNWWYCIKIIPLHKQIWHINTLSSLIDFTLQNIPNNSLTFCLRLHACVRWKPEVPPCSSDPSLNGLRLADLIGFQLAFYLQHYFKVWQHIFHFTFNISRMNIERIVVQSIPHPR
jgi:hypothetical protein